MTAVPGVPVEATQIETVAKAIASARWSDLAWEWIVEHSPRGAEAFRREAAAVLPSLREVIAAEVLPETVESKSGGVYFMPPLADVAEAWELVAEATVDELDEAALFSDYVRVALERTRAEVLAPVRDAIEDDGSDPERPTHPERLAGWRACAAEVRAALSAPVQAAERPRPVWEGPISDPAVLDALPQGSVAVDDVGAMRQLRFGNSYMGGGWTAHGNDPLSSRDLVEDGDRPVWVMRGREYRHMQAAEEVGGDE